MTKTSGTKEWAENNVNCIVGCSNDCRYCYARGMAIRFGRRTNDTWNHETQRNATNLVRKYNGTVMFPTTHDLHIETVDWWFPVLKGLLEKGNRVLVVSKPQFEAIAYICENLIEYKEQMEFRFTIGTNNDIVIKFWEPNAPVYSERRHALEYAHASGYKTSVSMEPLLIRDPTHVVAILEPLVSDTIWIGTMNHMRKSDFKDTELPWYYEQVAINSYENMSRVYTALKDNPKVRWKDSVQKLLGVRQNGKCVNPP